MSTMPELSKTKKLCANGHLMDPAWAVCPYCPSDRKSASPELAKTVKVEETVRAAAPAAAPAPRKTEIISNAPRIDGLAWLVATNGPQRGRMYKIDGERMTIGAAGDCDITVEETHVSDHHASVRFRDGGFVITDLDSTNGTFVGGERIEQRPLADGDRVRFGSSEWTFKCVVFESR
jgi:hypothetical protein